MFPSGERVVGGVFPLPERLDRGDDRLLPALNHPGLVPVLNWRSGFLTLVEYLGPRRIWYPSYLCPSMVEVLEKRREKVHFFGVSEHLSAQSWEWLSDVSPDDIVVVISYFGAPPQQELFERARATGATIVEDSSQALFRDPEDSPADYVIYSLRKYLGVPDGGLLVCLRCPKQRLELDGLLKQPPWGWWTKSLQVVLERAIFDVEGGERSWFRRFREVEGNVPHGLFRMTSLSWGLALTAFDYRSIARARRRNYRVLERRLGALALLPGLGSRSVPVGFPVVLEGRDRVKGVLHKNLVFPPVHWDLSGCVPSSFANSHWLSRRIMTIPCDQRYSAKDMESVARIVVRSVNGG